jgi:putative transcriptional regulator
MLEVIKFKLKELLTKKGHVDKQGRITWRKTAGEIGISHVALWKIANNEDYNPSLQILDRLCEFFKVQPGEILEYKKK